MVRPLFLVLSGDGINCEVETANALEECGASAVVRSLNQLLEAPRFLREVEGLIIPGGFSFGDELGAGNILSLKIKYGLGEEWSLFLKRERPIMGICNGFQALCRLGLLPGWGERCVALTKNDEGLFINRWVSLKVPKGICLWTKGMGQLELPIRNGEGRLVLGRGSEEGIYNKLRDHGQIALEYVSGEGVNGSYGGIAGLCDTTGRILGLMPHPEAAVFGWTFPGREKQTPGKRFFKNIVEHILWEKESKQL